MKSKNTTVDVSLEWGGGLVVATQDVPLLSIAPVLMWPLEILAAGEKSFPVLLTVSEKLGAGERGREMEGRRSEDEARLFCQRGSLH